MADFHHTNFHRTDWTIRTPNPWWAAPRHQPQPPPIRDESPPPRHRAYRQYVSPAAMLWFVLTRRPLPPRLGSN